MTFANVNHRTKIHQHPGHIDTLQGQLNWNIAISAAFNHQFSLLVEIIGKRRLGLPAASTQAKNTVNRPGVKPNGSGFQHVLQGLIGKFNFAVLGG